MECHIRRYPPGVYGCVNILVDTIGISNWTSRQQNMIDNQQDSMDFPFRFALQSQNRIIYLES